MATETDFLAFAEYVRNEAFQIGMMAKNGRAEEASKAALSLCSQAAAKKRELLGMPEPDPSIDYDADYHWDGTQRLPGEPRREKVAAADGYDLSELNRRREGGGVTPPA